MVTDNDFLDLQDRFNALKLTVDTMVQNLLTPALTMPGTLRFGTNNLEANPDGLNAVVTDSGDALASVPKGVRMRWFKDKFKGNPVAEVSGGYSTPGVNTFHQLVLRTLSDNADAGSTKVGVWSETSTIWKALFAIQNIDISLMTFSYPISGTVTPVFVLQRVDDNNFTLSLRTGGALVTIGSGVATDAIWDAKGDLAVGTGADTAAALTVGTDGKRLAADSATATYGLGWKSFFFNMGNPNSGSFAVTSDMKFINAALTGNLTINLYSAATIGAGDVILIKRTDTTGYTCTIDGNSSQTIDGSLTITLGALESVMLVSDGGQWWVC